MTVSSKSKGGWLLLILGAYFLADALFQLYFSQQTGVLQYTYRQTTITGKHAQLFYVLLIVWSAGSVLAGARLIKGQQLH